MEVKAAVRKAGLYCDADLSNTTMQKKVRAAQLSQYNYILVVGKEEMEKGTVNIRTRDNVVQGSKTIAELLAEFEKMMDDRTLDVELGVPKSADKGDAEQ
jgi:threonyl-tRNA synthetase